MFGGLSAPDGPSMPFGSPILVVLDLVRVFFVIVPAVVNVLVLPYVLATRDMGRGQISRLAGSAFLSAAAFGTSIDHLGDYGNYRLPLSAIGVTLLAVGVFKMIVATPTRDNRSIR